MEKRKYLLLVLFLMSMAVAYAQPDLSKTKFYRVKNHTTGRYMTLKDNKGELNVSKGKFDFGAIVPIASYEEVRCDPGSVIMWEEPTPLAYYLNAQGTSTKDIVSMPVKLQTVAGYDGVYAMYGTAKKNGISVSAYLCDTGTDTGLYWCSYKDLSTKNGFWEIIPVTDNDNYFAALPEREAKGKYYTTLYTAFGYQLGTETTAYFVDKVSKDGSLQVKKINPGSWIPAGSAVILECVSKDPERNKLLPVEYTTPLSGNTMKGVYFNNSSSKHKNQTAYDPSLMRVLTVNAEGNIVFGKTKDKFLAANRAYLTVPSDCPDELIVPFAQAKVYETHTTPVENPEDKMNHGTAANPISVANAIAYANTIGTDASTKNFYVKGKISSIKYEYSAQYGTATYNISEDGSTGKEFTVYGSYYFNNMSWQKGQTQIAVGDEVVVCGRIVNYNNNTPEFADKLSYLVSLNGKTSSDPVENPEDKINHGTVDEPISVAAAIAAAEVIGTEASVNDFYIKGKICSIKYEYSAQYGTATYNISEDGSEGTEFTVYGSYYLDGKAWQDGDEQIAKGDEVIVCGKIINYNGNTPEFVSKQNYLVSLNKPSGIQNVKIDETKNGAVYNLTGQRVGKPTQKGIYLINGKKVLVK